LVLKKTGLPPECLILEVTESTAVSDPEAAIARMRRLRSLGVQIALDDFGTGYSSLTYLHRFPVCALKIDRSFLSRMTESKSDTEIVRTIVTLAHNLGLKVIAEGVETVEQVNLLQFMGVEFGQGFYFSRPVSAEAMAQLLVTKPQVPTEVAALDVKKNLGSLVYKALGESSIGR
jgi:EAL domain-containing protein (putative c-di-GMP-specific phosphodiesterase class I)